MELNEKKVLDLDFYETVIAYNCLLDSTYLSSIVDYLDVRFFKNRDIKSIVSIIIKFFKERGTVPTQTEIKAYLVSDDLKESFKRMVGLFIDIDKKFDKTELTDNTELFLKEKAVYHALLDAAEKLDSKQLNTAELLTRIEKAVGVNLSQNMGIELFSEIDDFIKDLHSEEPHIKTGWKWLDNRCMSLLVKRMLERVSF